MHILILNWRDPKNPLSGGAEVVTLAHAKGWLAAGHSVTWFSACFPGSPRQNKIDGVSIIRRGGLYTVYLAAVFYYIAHRHNFDIVIDEIHFIPFFTPLYVRKPVVAFIHEVAGEIWNYTSPFPINWFGKIFENFYFHLYRSVPFWTDARSTINDLVKHGIDRSKCRAIPCPALNKPLTRLPQKEHQQAFIFVSRIVKMKGIEDVIRAFSKFGRSMNAKLWIVGDGCATYLQRLQALIQALGLDRNSVHFFGKVTSVKKLELMRKAHLLLHASVKEGWGLVVIEAASQATPAVVYNVAGLRDSVKNGVTGIVLTNNSPDEMAYQVSLLMRDKKRYELYQKNCLAWAKSLTWEKATSQSLQLLSSITS